MNLVIVESPAKARKLRSYLGNDFLVEASVGHIRDLPVNELGVDVENDFQPSYTIVKGKKKVLNQLTKSLKDSQSVYLAMDPDREGEAIAWHVKTLLESVKVGKNKTFFRSTFHEITSSAVMAAINKPTQINMDLVDAQQARRILDRLVGYKVSPVLWRKVRRGLSAGRVQSPALRLIVQREKEILAFKPVEYWEVDVALNVDRQHLIDVYIAGKLIDVLPTGMLIARVIKLDNGKYEPKTAADVQDVIKSLAKAIYHISEVEKKERRRSSLPPFTTSTLQQQAAYKLGMTSKQTMHLAQQLYEEGLITYHRTDSVNLAASAITAVRDFVVKSYGASYLPEKPRYFANKSKNAQEAHEAIRVTNVEVQSNQVIAISGKFTPRHQQLYDLIWRRFVASQMQTAIYDQTTVVIEAVADKLATKGFKQATLKSSGSVLKFDGWLKLFSNQTDTFLPKVTKNQTLFFAQSNAAQKFTLPPPRYNDASLVKELEKLGIGRPSTYASIISVLEDRSYVSREDKKFIPTVIGITVSDFLMENFTQIVDYDFTAEMEEDLDRIARGEKKWKKIMADFYQPFAKKIADVLENSKRAKIPVEKLNLPCPECGKTDQGELVLRTGRFGKFISCSRFPDCKYTKNYQQKLDGVNCPLCTEGAVVIKNTRGGSSFYGCSRYPDCDWASWKAPQKGESLTKEAWVLIQSKRAKRKKNRAKTKKKK